MKIVLTIVFTVLLNQAFSQWKLDKKKSDETYKVYNCAISKIKLDKIVDGYNNEDISAVGGIIEMLNWKINRAASGDWLRINTKGVLEDLVKTRWKRCSVQIFFTDGSNIKDIRATHSCEVIDKNITNCVEYQLTTLDIKSIKSKIISKIIINNKTMTIPDGDTYKKVACVVWSKI